MPRLACLFCRDERGATATEYAMLIIFIALAIAGGATLLGSKHQQSLQQPWREHLGSDALTVASNACSVFLTTLCHDHNEILARALV